MYLYGIKHVSTEVACIYFGTTKLVVTKLSKTCVLLACCTAHSYLSVEKSPPHFLWQCHAQAAIYDFSTPSSSPFSCLFLCPCDLRRAENERVFLKSAATT